MSPQRRQRRAAVTLALDVIAIGALVVSVWLVSSQSDAKLRAQSAAALRQANVQQRAGCARGAARDFESYGTNRDLRDFARDAAKARRADGNTRIARRYDQRAASAEFRMRRIRLRLPANEDEATIVAFCRTLYPEAASSSG